MSHIKTNIISKFGGVGIVAKICGVTASAVSQWELIPSRHQIKLLMAAQSEGIDLSAESFFEQTTTPKNKKGK